MNARTAMETLQGLRQIEEFAKKLVQMLVEALLTPQDGPELAADSVWALNKLALGCEAACGWVREAGGGFAARQAISKHHYHKDLVCCSVCDSSDCYGHSAA